MKQILNKLWKGRDFLYYNRKKLLVGMIFLILFAVVIFQKGKTGQKEEMDRDFFPIMQENETEEKKEEEKTEKEETVFVDIKGRVKNPGIYEMSLDQRVSDAILLAGGLLEDADTSSINLSKKVTDEMVIIIPSLEEKKESSSSSSSSLPNDAEIEQPKEEHPNLSSSKVSINKATMEELMSVKGIGEVKAKAIIEYRTTNGLFHSLEEIQNVKGIGKATFEKIKDYITL